MSIHERVRLTTSCRDCDKILKVENAGVVKVFNNEKYSICSMESKFIMNAIIARG
jgi:hypothetical protein